uniref:Uncharacterized protein n=1 Tax=Oryza barthii TaxID=65489 RepID=A0A0D3F4W0_9ORYZ
MSFPRRARLAPAVNIHRSNASPMEAVLNSRGAEELERGKRLLFVLYQRAPPPQPSAETTISMEIGHRSPELCPSRMQRESQRAGWLVEVAMRTSGEMEEARGWWIQQRRPREGWIRHPWPLNG